MMDRQMYAIIICVLFIVAMLSYYMGIRESLEYRKFVQENCTCRSDIDIGGVE